MNWIVRAHFLFFVGALSFVAGGQTAKPSIRVLWDISKGYTYRELPLGFGSEDGFADVLITYSEMFRRFFPGDRQLPSGTPVMVAENETSYEQFINAGTFPDIVQTSSRTRFTPNAYINLSARGIANENLAAYDAIFIVTNTAAYHPYSSQESEMIRKFVADGGRLIVASDNFWTPRANLIPIMSIFGVEPTMQLTSSMVEFKQNESIFEGLRSVHARAGAGLCVGESPGWHLTPAEVAEIERFGNGRYEYYLSRYRSEYAVLTAEEHCQQKAPPAGVSVELLAFDRVTHEFTGIEEQIPVVAKARLGAGSALIFADVSWYDNSMRIIAQNQGLGNEKLIENVAKYLSGR
jgi:hypothetical protein